MQDRFEDMSGNIVGRIDEMSNYYKSFSFILFRKTYQIMRNHPLNILSTKYRKEN